MDVKKGMKKFVASYIKGLEEAEDNVTPEPDQCKKQKLPDAVLKRREQARLLGILDSDDEQDPSTHTTGRRDSERRRKEAHNESELDLWYTYVPLKEVESTSGLRCSLMQTIPFQVSPSSLSTST